ncbi:hypothetical protein M408DRAFT_92099 [Serendipita vermifera MAFF 305830]|uniref:Uncharacterized protein n=1 Tax=Serendipita vermifera MAFF 305830 TaxID=933852 RepID=A0A0C2XZC5_SERVB|nr:hypothetical protein M408DRAFT_92099 [Serendipita vermifera MAFF 305830]
MTKVRSHDLPISEAVWLQQQQKGCNNVYDEEKRRGNEQGSSPGVINMGGRGKKKTCIGESNIAKQ